MKKSIIFITEISLCLILSGCSLNNDDSKKEVSFSTDISTTNTASKDASNAAENNAKSDTASSESNKTDNSKITEIKEYLTTELGWSKAFVAKMDINSLYQKFIKESKNKDGYKDFSEYLNKNLKVTDNWKELFEKDLSEKYDVKPVRYEDLGNNLYQVYVKVDNEIVPYVTVNALTGWFHG